MGGHSFLQTLLLLLRAAPASGVPVCWLYARSCKIELSPSFRDQILRLASGSWGKRAVLGKGERLSAGMAGASG